MTTKLTYIMTAAVAVTALMAGSVASVIAQEHQQTSNTQDPRAAMQADSVQATGKVAVEVAKVIALFDPGQAFDDGLDGIPSNERAMRDATSWAMDGDVDLYDLASGGDSEPDGYEFPPFDASSEEPTDAIDTFIAWSWTLVPTEDEPEPQSEDTYPGTDENNDGKQDGVLPGFGGDDDGDGRQDGYDASDDDEDEDGDGEQDGQDNPSDADGDGRQQTPDPDNEGNKTPPDLGIRGDLTPQAEKEELAIGRGDIDWLDRRGERAENEAPATDRGDIDWDDENEVEAGNVSLPMVLNPSIGNGDIDPVSERTPALQ